MLEKELEKKCCNYAKKHNYICIKLANYGLGSNFYPDRLFLRNGKIFFVEFKNPNKKGKLSLGQREYFKDVEEQDCNIYIVDNYDYFKNIIDKEINNNG